MRLTGRDPVEDERLLKASATPTSRRRCSSVSGACPTAWISSTNRPCLCKTRLDQLQGELADFRTRYSLLEPTAEGGAKRTKPPWPPRCWAWKPTQPPDGFERRLLVAPSPPAASRKPPVTAVGKATLVSPSAMWTRACCNSCSRRKQSWQKPLPIHPGSSDGARPGGTARQLRPLLRQNQLEAVTPP